MQSITTKDSIIHFNNACYTHLEDFLNTSDISMVFILVDENTKKYCLPKFKSSLKTHLPLEILEIESGEFNKNIDTCADLWAQLSASGADRKSLLINLGGGVITDLGGFVASTFKRGIEYINIPTSLLAMVDASVGGKTGVDLDNLKNQIGVINSGKMVLIDTSFLETLPNDHLISGKAEMLKHGLIHNDEYLLKMEDEISNGSLSDIDQLIYESVIIKNSIVTKDPTEQNIRKTLNFGHTIGHAIESYFLENAAKPDLLHGEAIALGMIMECYLSSELFNFPKDKLKRVVQVVNGSYPSIVIEESDYNGIIELLKYDKKNEHGNVNFVLLENVGRCILDCKVDNELIIRAFDYYNGSMKN